MPNLIEPGDVSMRPLYGWANQSAHLERGLSTFQFVGWTKLDTTPRNELEIELPSLKVRVQGKPYIVPAGSTIYRIALRLPRAIRSDENFMYGVLPKNTQILGTAGENLKLASTTAAHTATSPSIVCNGDGTYTPNASAVLCANEWQALSGQLATVNADTTFKLYVSNAANTAAGNGVRLSSGEAYVLAEICFKMANEAIDFERAGYPYQPENLVKR
jgi:hypothetical protein